METKTWTFIDRSKWHSGSWDSEPDKIQWQDPTTGLPCLAVRHDMHGHWCGYVGVSSGHPYFEHDYEDVADVSVHGGLTFASSCQHGVCHEPGAGEPDHVWWFGFDCAHADDLPPIIEGSFYYGVKFRYGEYRTLEYVQAECARLAGQLVNDLKGME